MVPLYQHTSVMPEEVARYLACRPGGVYADGTLGGCGHTRRILTDSAPDGVLIGTDLDPAAIGNAKRQLAAEGDRIHLFQGSFARLPEFMAQAEIKLLDGILLDLGISTNQLVNSGRGFSFRREEPLDMRMDSTRGRTAADLVNTLDKTALARIFRSLGEEPAAARVAARIVKERQVAPITTSLQLAELVSAVIRRPYPRKGRIHPATKVFMALRIAVNRELERLETFLQSAADLLAPGGRICILAFHSLEDRIVKHSFRALQKGCTCPPDFPQCTCGRQPQLHVLTKRAVKPSEAEIEANPPSRSTRLRAAEKIPGNGETGTGR